jgi:hypothetical protein
LLFLPKTHYQTLPIEVKSFDADQQRKMGFESYPQVSKSIHLMLM